MDDAEFSALKAHYDAILPTLATKADIEVLRAEMHKMSAEGYRWMVASMIGMFLGFGGLYFASTSNLRAPATTPAATPAPQPAATQLQPIIIYLPPASAEKRSRLNSN